MTQSVLHAAANNAAVSWSRGALQIARTDSTRRHITSGATHALPKLRAWDKDIERRRLDPRCLLWNAGDDE